MSHYRIAAVCAAAVLVAGCNDGRKDRQEPASTRTAAAGDCPDVPAAAPPKDEKRADRTMFDQLPRIPPPPVQVVLSVKCLAAGATIAKHKHPWQRYVYLESGSVTVTWEAPVPQVKTFSAGDLLVESHDIWHSVQVGDAPAKLVVIDQVPATVPPTPNVIEWTGPGPAKKPAG